MAALVAVGAFVLAPPAVPQAAAAEVGDAVTDVHITESSVPDGRAQLRLNIAFEVGADAAAGDTFWVQLDPTLLTRAFSYNIYAEGSSTQIVARMTTTLGGRVTFTLTDYVDDRSATEGTVNWLIKFRNNRIPAGAHDLTFETASTTFTDTVTTRGVYVPDPGDPTEPPPSGPARNTPSLYAGWITSNVENRRGTWTAVMANGPATTVEFESYGWDEVGGPEWDFDCTRTLQNGSGYRRLFAPAVQVELTCNDDYFYWKISGLPNLSSAGLQPLIRVDFDVTDPSRVGNLTIRMSGTFTVTTADGTVTPSTLNTSIRQTIGSGAIGAVRPVVPQVVQGLCEDGVPVPPQIIDPVNTGGLTYLKNTEDYGPGDTVTMLAELTTRYWWEDDVSPYVLNDDETVATYDITLDEAPDCMLSPQNPTITQAQCNDEGGLDDPQIAFADVTGLTYTTDPATYGPGDEVTLIATLGTGRAWNTPLPTGWVEDSPSVATRSITLDDEPGDCRLVSTPSEPIVEQTICSDGEQVAPSVDLPAAANGITYELEGDVAAGGAVAVVATLNDDLRRWPDAMPAGWERTSDTEARYAIQFADPSCRVETAPVDPTVVQTTCADGQQVAPQVNPQSTDGITYAVSPADYGPGDEVTVTATLAGTTPDGEAWVWGTMPSTWNEDSPTQASFTVTLADPPCTREVVPADPAITQAVCADGEQTTPSVVPATTDGITYEVSPAGYGPGDVVTVTATLTGTSPDGEAWVWGAMPSTWTEDSDTQASFTVTLADPPCTIPVSPVDPQVTQTVCVDGAQVAPSVVLASTDGISYEVSPSDYGPGDTVTVTATLAGTTPDGEAWVWGAMPDNWTEDSDTQASFTVTLADPPCTIPVSPVDPDVTQTACADGQQVAPSVALASTEGISYEVSPADYGPGDEVTVTATLAGVTADGERWVWGSLPLSWTETSDTEAEFTVTLEDPECTTAVYPMDPTVTQTACSDGQVILPDVDAAPGTAGITYAVSPADYQPGDVVTVTATLTGPEYVWGPTTLALGSWTYISDTQAEFTVDLDDPACTTPVTPVAPTVAQTTCDDGAVVTPAVDPAAGDASITYDIDGTVAPGGTVNVVATLAGPEYVWADTLPAGWEWLSASTAEFAVTLDPADCQVAPGPNNPNDPPAQHNPDAGGDTDDGLADTGVIGPVLPIGLTAAGLLLLGALLVALRSQRVIREG